MKQGATLRILHVGCGSMSHAWLETALTLPGVQIVGLVDIFEDAARQKALAYGLQEVFIGTDLHAALDQTAPDIVFDCTVPEAHYAVTLAALKHGCHVLGEKPLADSMEHAREMIAAAQEANRLFAVIQNRRYDANIRRLSRFLRSNALGTLTTLNSDFYIGAHFGGFRDHMRHVLLLDMAIHTFDAARLLAQADPISVYCQEWNPVGSWYDQDASAIAIFEMSNGIRYTYRGSWGAEGLPTTWEADWRIIGQHGSVLWDGGSQMRAQVVARREGFISPYQELSIAPADANDPVDGHAGIIREFVDCVRNGSMPETICTDNIKSLAMVFGAIESSETGKTVTIKL